MTPNEELITRFYTALQQKDFAAMGECYHPEATFKDEAFDLKTVEEIRGMWKMLCLRGKDMRVEFRDVIRIAGDGVKAHWDAWYSFSKTGRQVHNSIDSTFTFKDGLILQHRDRFPFYRWSRQALGTPAVLLGWTGFFHKKVRANAMEGLREFMKKNN
jgi:ketosteroid isomerase-like protein